MHGEALLALETLGPELDEGVEREEEGLDGVKPGRDNTRIDRQARSEACI